MEQKVYEAIAKSLRAFGYPDVTAAMIEDCHKAYKQGTGKYDMPHGVVGGMAYPQIKEAYDLGLLK